jgi:hypothetical protein
MTIAVDVLYFREPISVLLGIVLIVFTGVFYKQILLVSVLYIFLLVLIFVASKRNKKITKKVEFFKCCDLERILR